MAIRSVRGLSNTIDGLIDKEKERISEKFESQLMSHITNITNERSNTYLDSDLNCRSQSKSQDSDNLSENVLKKSRLAMK